MKFSQLLRSLSPRSLLATGACLIMAGSMPLTAEAVITVAHNFPRESNWTFNHEMTQSESDPNTWTTEISITGCEAGTDANTTAWFTFFDGVVSGWPKDKRFGAGDSEPVIVSGTEYAAQRNNEKCFIVNTDGTYTITFILTDDNNAKITFTRTGDYNPEIDPIPDPDPDPDPSDNPYVYFYNSSNWEKVCVWAWDNNGNITSGNYPGEEMTLLDSGFYYWESTSGRTPTQFIISDGNTKAGGGNLNFVNGAYFTPNGSYTMTAPEIDPIDPPIDPPVDPVDPSDPSGNFVNGVFIPNESDAKYSKYFPTDKEYVFFVNQNNWEAKIWAWGENSANATGGTWPGQSMAQYKGNVYIWVNDTDVLATQLIISNNGGTKAGDGDLAFFNGATYYSDGSHKGGSIVVPPTPSENAGAVSEWVNEDGVVKVTCEKATLFITPYSEKVVKVFTLPAGSTQQERESITVVATPSENLDISVNDRDDALIISVNTSALQIGVDKETGLLTFSEGITQKLQEHKYLDNTTHSVQFSTQNGNIAFYGGGPTANKGSIMGSTIEMNHDQEWGWNSGSTRNRNIGIPFVTSTSNYGILFDDHYRGAKINPTSDGLNYSSGSLTPISYYYVGGDDMDEVIANYTALTGRQPLPPYWALGYITSKYGYHSEIEANEVIGKIKGLGIPLDGIVFDLFWEGETEDGMGNLEWYTPNFPNPEKMLKDWKDQGIHTTVITEPYFTSVCTRNYNDAKSNGYFATENQSGMEWVTQNGSHPNSPVGLLDASNQDALEWMYSFYKQRTEEGMSGWWLDLGEPEKHDDNCHHQGGTVAQVHNEFGQLWLGHIHDRLTEDFPEMRQFLMPRSGTSGMQRYSAFPWTGDIERSWSGLQAQVPSLINMSMAGVSFIGSDVGGFANTGSTPWGNLAPLYLRWIQFGALSPVLRTHSQQVPEPFNDNYASVADGVRKAINLRYRLLPYVYTLAYENSAFGYPMARPACAFDQDKYLLADNNNSYMWGRDIFVAPILTEGDSRDITFPQGNWVDMNQVLAGGQQPTVYTGHSNRNYNAGQNIPFFMRQGSFIPMFTQSNEGATDQASMSFQNTADLNYNDLTVYHAFSTNPDENHECILYEDDRTSRSALETGKYSVTKFQSVYEGGSGGSEGRLFSIDITQEGDASVRPDTRTIHLYCYGYDGHGIDGLRVILPQSVQPQSQKRRANGVSTLADDSEEPTDYRELFKDQVKNSLEEAQNSEDHAIYHDTDNQMLYVKAANVPTTGNIRLQVGSIPTAVTDVLTSNVSLSYSGGQLNYSVGTNATEAVIEIFSADGRLIATVNPTVFNGHVNSVEAPAADGFCIARLTARDAYGNVKTANCKYFVK